MSDITPETVPEWCRGVRTRYDETRDRWMILGPERILVPEGPGADIARLVDGDRTVADIVDRLRDEYAGDEPTITEQTIEFLDDLQNRGYLES